VDSFNLPMEIDNDAGCGVPKCNVDLGPNCQSFFHDFSLKLTTECLEGPAQLAGPFDSTGFTVGCKSACSARLALDPNNYPNCCTGMYGFAAICPSSGIQSYSYFSESLPAPSRTFLTLACNFRITLPRYIRVCL
jgi:hypothetical protein